MDRIGRKLISESKSAAMGSGEKGENWRARDLLTLLVKANISKDVSEHQRLSDSDVLARMPQSSSQHSCIGNVDFITQRYPLSLLLDTKPPGTLLLHIGYSLTHHSISV